MIDVERATRVCDRAMHRYFRVAHRYRYVSREHSEVAAFLKRHERFWMRATWLWLCARAQGGEDFTPPLNILAGLYD